MPEKTRKKGCIFCIDEDNMICTSIEKVLNQHGYDAITCSDGEKAVALFAEVWKDVDLLLLDLNMVQMEGWKVFARLKSINPPVPIVLLSGFENGNSAFPKGMKGYIRKPFKSAELIQIIDQVLPN